MRKKADADDAIPAIMPNEMSSKESRQNWARLTQKIYEVDPLTCPKCWGQMRIISFIEELDAGHHFKYGHDLRSTFEAHGDRIPVVHLHGVDFSGPTPKDHIGLDRLPDEMFDLTTKLLASYEGGGFLGSV